MKAFHSSLVIAALASLLALQASLVSAANVVVRGDVAHLSVSGAARSIALEFSVGLEGASSLPISAHQLRATLAGPGAALTLQSAGVPTLHPYLGPSSAPVATITGSRVDAGDISFAGAVSLTGLAGLLRVELAIPGGLASGVYPLRLSSDPQFTFVADSQGVPLTMQIVSGGVRIAGRSGDFDFDTDVDALDLLVWQRDFGQLGLSAADENANNVVDAADFTLWRDARGMGRRLGDYDSDQDVDAADYGLWRSQFGSSVPRDTLADGNNSGLIDAADYTLWRDHRVILPTSATSSIPEPAASALLLLAAGLCINSRGATAPRRTARKVSRMLKRPQFSLLTLLMVMTIVALAIAAYREYFAASRLRLQNSKLTQQRQLLAARSGDWEYIQPDEFHACMLDELLALRVKGGLHAWQVHIPQDHFANVYVIWNKIEPAEKLWNRCKNAPSLLLSPGGQLVSFRVFNDRKGQWNYELSSRGMKLECPLNAQDSAWLDSDSRFRRNDPDPQGVFRNDQLWTLFFGGASGIHSLVPSGKLVLLLDRYPNSDEIQLDAETPTNGFAILLHVEKNVVRARAPSAR